MRFGGVSSQQLIAQAWLVIFLCLALLRRTGGLWPARSDSDNTTNALSPAVPVPKRCDLPGAQGRAQPLLLHAGNPSL